MKTLMNKEKYVSPSVEIINVELESNVLLTASGNGQLENIEDGGDWGTASTPLNMWK